MLLLQESGKTNSKNIDLLTATDSSVGKEPACNSADPGWIPGSGRSPGEGTGNPLQYSCLENSIDRGAWQATVHGVTKSQTQLSNFTFFLFLSIIKVKVPANFFFF